MRLCSSPSSKTDKKVVYNSCTMTQRIGPSSYQSLSRRERFSPFKVSPTMLKSGTQKSRYLRSRMVLSRTKPILLETFPAQTCYRKTRSHAPSHHTSHRGLEGDAPAPPKKPQTQRRKLYQPPHAHPTAPKIKR